MNQTEPIEPEVVNEETGEVLVPTRGQLRNPSVPATLNDLAALKKDAADIIEARIQVLRTLRKAAIFATSPEDWLLFRGRDGGVIGYLQDCGADRVRDLYGIEIYHVEEPVRIPDDGSVPFHYLIRASGRCRLTGQTIEGIEGGRSSSDDFCSDKKGAALELDVRKAARANLNGQIVRELSGLQNVPESELRDAWVGTGKTIERCRKGRGYGSRAERQGAQVQQSEVAVQDEPLCTTCNPPRKMDFVPAGKSRTTGKPFSSFWSCPEGGQGKKHDRVTIWHEEWLKRLAERKGTNGHAEPPDDRQPGQEG